MSEEEKQQRLDNTKISWNLRTRGKIHVSVGYPPTTSVMSQIRRESLRIYLHYFRTSVHPILLKYEVQVLQCWVSKRFQLQNVVVSYENTCNNFLSGTSLRLGTYAPNLLYKAEKVGRIDLETKTTHVVRANTSRLESKYREEVGIERTRDGGTVKLLFFFLVQESERYVRISWLLLKKGIQPSNQPEVLRKTFKTWTDRTLHWLWWRPFERRR